MSNRTVTYTIKLLSDIARQARADAAVIEGTNQRQAKSYQKMARDIDKAAQSAQKLETTAKQTHGALNTMGNGVGARMAKQIDIGIAKLKQMQKIAGDVGGKILKSGAMGVAGGYAAYKTADAMIEKPVAYEKRVARIAQTAYDGKDIGEFKDTQAQIQAGIKRATDAKQGGGGGRDDAARALDNMIASGQKLDAAIAALPAIMRTATASGADAKDLSDIVIKGVQNGFIQNTPEAIAAAMDKSVAAGRAGQFELPDMAKWLGQQMSAGKLAGLTGDKGFERLLVMNQAAMMSAGSKDEAGNNVVNLLAKLNSQDTAKDFQKQGFGDLSKYLIESTKKGGDSVDAWVSLLKNEMGKNKEYQSAQAQLQNAKTPEAQKAANESIVNLAMGTNIGKYFQDRQAIAALIPLLSDKTGVSQQTIDAINNSQGTVDFGVQTYGTTTAFKQEQAANTRDNAVTDAFTNLKPAIDSVIDGFTQLGQSMPNGAAVVAGGAGIVGTASSAVGAGMGGLYLWDMIKNRKSGKNLPAPSPIVNAPAPRTRDAMGVPLGNAAEVATTVPSRWNKAGRALGRGAKVGGIVGVAAMVGEPILNAVAGEGSATARYGSAAINGAALGATIGSIVPVLGTALGAAIGGAGGLLWEGIQSHMDASQPKAPEYLTNPQLNQAPQAIQPQQVAVKMQDGTLKIQVNVSPTSELISATAQAPQTIPLQLADGGSTNPAGYVNRGSAR